MLEKQKALKEEGAILKSQFKAAAQSQKATEQRTFDAQKDILSQLKKVALKQTNLDQTVDQHMTQIETLEKNIVTLQSQSEISDDSDYDRRRNKISPYSNSYNSRAQLGHATQQPRGSSMAPFYPPQRQTYNPSSYTHQYTTNVSPASSRHDTHTLRANNYSAQQPFSYYSTF